MGSPIKLLKKGSTPSMLDTATANELISAVNELRNMIVSPAGFGKFVVADKEVKLDLGALAKIISSLQKSSDAIINTTPAPSPGGPGGPGNDPRVPLIIAAINNSSISAACNGDGTITVTQIFPGLPS